MRHFFIRGFEILLSIFLILGLIGSIIAGVSLIVSPEAAAIGTELPPGFSGPAAGVALIVGGVIYTIFIGGLMFLGLGIYHNTRRMAEALERQ